MLRINNLGWLTFALILVFISLTVYAPGASAKKSKRSQPGNYLVPPPPVYMPSILPELRTSQNNSQGKPTNPYKKYVYSAEGYEDPVPVKSHKTVTYWNNSAPAKSN